MSLCPKNIFADLHNHTTASDGSFTPAELVAIAHRSGLGALGITDHDTIDGLREALNTAHEIPVRIVCGVEMTLRFRESYFTGSLHLLLYFSEKRFSDPVFRDRLKALLARGRGPALVTARVAAINEMFAPGGREPILPRALTEADVYRHGKRISRRHFAMALKDMGITDRDTVSSIIGNDSPAYIPSGVPLSDVAEQLPELPVVKILAHPAAGSYPGEGHYKEVLPPFETVEKLLPRFLEAGLDGFEICYPGHTDDWIERLDAIRKRQNLPLFTGGSDCHDGENRPLGVAGVSRETYDRLMSYIDAVDGAFQ